MRGPVGADAARGAGVCLSLTRRGDGGNQFRIWRRRTAKSRFLPLPEGEGNGASSNSQSTLQFSGLPMPIACNIHPFMKAWLLVKDDPSLAVTAEPGEFEIHNLPAEEHDLPPITIDASNLKSP